MPANILQFLNNGYALISIHNSPLSKETDFIMHLPLSDRRALVVDVVQNNPHFQESYWTHHIAISEAHAQSYHLKQDKI